MKDSRYTIHCTKEQLMCIAHAVEDWHRFLAGQCELLNATCFLQHEDMQIVHEILEGMVRPYIVPELKYRGSSYKWNGGNCPNKHQRKMIAMSYGIYRQILHFFASQRKDDHYNVYNSETLTCDEQGPLIEIKEITNNPHNNETH